MKISALQDCKIFDLGTREEVEAFCSKFKITENEIIVDISRCIIDYPATSILVDYVLDELSQQKGLKSFTIITNLNINELLLLHWLLIGSVFFGIEHFAKNKNLKEFKEIITEKLDLINTQFIVKIIDKEEKTVKFYNYG